MCADNISRHKNSTPRLRYLFSQGTIFSSANSRSQMTCHENLFPLFKILVFEILFLLYMERGISKKSSWKQNASCGGILTWQPCASDFTITRDVKHHVLSKNRHLSASRNLFLFFSPNHTLGTQQKKTNMPITYQS